MKIKCEYCEGLYEDTLSHCPNCGAVNPNQKETKGTPKTIRELEAWYQSRHLPPYGTTRFYIGIDYRNPRAFGIYRDESTGDFVVYKNKADGTRAVRYRGKDEAYAVNELFQKLKDEIVHQKSAQGSRSGNSWSPGKRTSRSRVPWHMIFVTAWFLGVIIFCVSGIAANRHNGYYRYAGDTYYLVQNDWYVYDSDYADWYPVDRSAPEVKTMEDSYEDFYESKTWNSSIDATDWDDSSYYSDYHSSSDSDYSSDYDWDSGSSWDSGGTDWDSDW